MWWIVRGVGLLIGLVSAIQVLNVARYGDSIHDAWLWLAGWAFGMLVDSYGKHRQEV